MSDNAIEVDDTPIEIVDTARLFQLEELRTRADAVRRLAGDKLNYETELRKEHERLQRLQRANKKDKELAEQKRIIEDRKFMLPYVRTRLIAETSALEALMQVADDLDETDEYSTAMDVLLTAQRVIRDWVV